MIAKNIMWETDGKDITLPTKVQLPNTLAIEHETSVADWLSDKYGWLVQSLEIDHELTKEGAINATHELLAAIAESGEWVFGDEATDGKYIQALNKVLGIVEFGQP